MFFKFIQIYKYTYNSELNIMKPIYFIPLIALLFFLKPETLPAQDSTNTINAFLDCRRACDESHVRNEIQFVNYVRNEEEADVHLMITSQRTGNGGEEYTLEFIARNETLGPNRTLTYFSPESDTNNERRDGLNNYISRGLFFYLADQPISEQLIINHVIEEESQSGSDSDKWNDWVFDINASTNLEGEESEKEFSLRGRISAERVTQDWKFEFDMSQFYDQRTIRDDDDERTFTRQNRDAELLLVKSLNNHWSAGISLEAGNSTRNNYSLLLEGSPAIEYSIFPYREFTRRKITFTYRLTGGYYNYEEMTVFEKSEESLIQHQLSSQIEFTQPWGDFETRINASAFLHDFDKKRLDISSQLDFRIYRGFSVFISGEYALINDQLSLPAGGITNEEQLLNLREQSTSYSYELRFGLQLSFGSIFNNVVNPRLSRF